MQFQNLLLIATLATSVNTLSISGYSVAWCLAANGNYAPSVTSALCTLFKQDGCADCVMSTTGDPTCQSPSKQIIPSLWLHFCEDYGAESADGTL
ncbi:hypothetical protein HYALB_00013928 [Hymenoscyphus albidus]|uniref:Uncharacterized protein n=1 Tax=Hymenoscyphus albidus TaxID=595503 RepID=A0A9N9LX90_9HELO|nr:hypothetical protein HYALB_00013928 [Hymenoscyphus albidus]